MIKEQFLKRLISIPMETPKSVIIIRFMAGLVFLWEGVLKFVYVNQGVGRFTKLGFPFPIETAHFVAVGEILGGIMLLMGFLTRLVSIYFIIEMIVAILSTKITLYFGTSPLPKPPAPPLDGFWAVLHEIRSDYAQIMCCLFLFLAGPGIISLDSWLTKHKFKST